MMAACKVSRVVHLAECINLRTLARRVLAKVLGLVAAQDTRGLDLGGRATRELLVEIDDALHLSGVRSARDGLGGIKSA